MSGEKQRPDVEVLAVATEREEIDLAHPTAGAEVAAALREVCGGRAGADPRPPLARERLTIEIRGRSVSTAVANALRRVLAGELRGHCLTFGREDYDPASTDPFMRDYDFVRDRIRAIPLPPQIDPTVARDLRLELDAENPGPEVMMVMSGDLRLAAGELRAPIMNPTHEVAFIQPGCTLRIRNIRIAEGSAREDAAFSVAVRAALKPLDLEELPREATHGPGGAAAEQSGYALSSLKADPRHFRVSCCIPAVPRNSAGARAVAVDACRAVADRLRRVQRALGAAAEKGGLRGTEAWYLVSAGAGGAKGELAVRGETHTIGNLLRRAVYELKPGVASVSYTCIEHEGVMRLTVVDKVADPAEVAALIGRAVAHSLAVFAELERGIRAFR